MNTWIAAGGPQNEIILSSRIRLARNLSDTPFPAVLDIPRANSIIDSIESMQKTDFDDQYKLYRIKDLSALEKQVLVERHLVSPNLISQGAASAALIKNNEIVSIMINEEDHIRIQSILPGFQVKKAWELANEIDDVIENKLEYAFDESWGYLTSCPTNVGTGMRASVMAHLPALNITSNINKILHAVTQIGLTIRGLYGEGTEFIGSIFQISNQITLGRSEDELVENLSAVTMQIIEKEKEARNMLMNNSRIQIEDKVWRSMGILKNARILKSQECLKLLSDIRLGADLQIIDNIPSAVLNAIMIDTQPASLQKHAGSELGANERDIYRAEMVREKLNI
ncbi:MAG: protein arginine kinase [Bacillota bacterium]